LDGDYDGAVAKYDEYLTKITAPTKQELLEYGDILFAAKQYENAIDAYDQILEEGDDFDVQLLENKSTVVDC